MATGDPAGQAGILAALLAGLGLVVVIAYYVARPWLRTRDERESRRRTRSQMSLLLTAGTPFQISDGLIDADGDPGDDVPGAGSDEDASGPIMRSAPLGTRLLKWVRSPPFGVRNWSLWALPRPAVALLLAVELTTVSCTVVLSVMHPVKPRRLEFFCAIVLLGIVAAEWTRGVERMRRWFSDTPHVNMSSVWTLSAAVLTTPVLAAATAVILYGHLWARSWYRVSGVQPYRVVFNVSSVVLSCLAAGAVARATPNGMTLAPTRASDLIDIVLVVIAYSTVNSLVAAGALALLRDQRSLRGVLGSWQENSIEYATLCVGVVLAAVLAWRPWLALLLLLPLCVLHRSVLVRQLEHAATVDEKTGLLNAATWHRLAAIEVERARRHGRSVGVLTADLDHFTVVNEVFGHAVGDQALRVVADVLCQEVRFGDLCGRLGGEEFAILLCDTGIGEAVEVADRVCQRIRSLRIHGDNGPVVRLSMSIGAAAYPNAGTELDEVLLAADNALFAAKDAGRSRARAARFGASAS
ncbi:MAG TPA: GGDEF domain-containing protein [Pseudonocardiaceae bacterium]|jgi:diguanylate cyclase (GGDEF)-like protein